jgi:uncharacterized protein (TIGR00304 family)
MTQPLNSRNKLQCLMKGLKALGLGLLVAGFIATVAGIQSGDIEVGLALFFIPYLRSSTWIGVAAMLLILAGVFVLMLSVFFGFGGAYENGAQATSSTARKKGEVGGVVLIGPIPIVFGSSNRAALIALIATALVVMALVVLLLLL